MSTYTLLTHILNCENWNEERGNTFEAYYRKTDQRESQAYLLTY